MTENVSPEMVERMIALVRGMTASSLGGETEALVALDAYVASARAIAAELPAPVDPDLVEARQVAVAYIRQRDGYLNLSSEEGILAGETDYGDNVRIALAAIKRGRTLATQGDR